MHVLLIFLFVIISQATADGLPNNASSCSLRHCTSCTKALVKCSNFTSFAEINLSNLAEIRVLDLQPLSPLFVNKSLLLHPNVTITKQLILRNIRGFIYDHDPFESNIKRAVELRLYNSTFQFYKSNTANLNCSFIRQNFSNVSILQHFSRIWLNGDMRFDGDLCPDVFKNTRIKFFLCQNMTLQNRLRFNNQDQGSDLNCTVSYLALINSKLGQLDHKTMPVSVFKHLRTLQVLGNLEGIETNLFSYFTQLKTLILELNNFTSLVRPGNMEWLGQLKSPSHSNDSLINNNNDLVVHLFDKSNVYQFTDTDFCTFQHFNPMLPIYPVIRTQPKLDCSSCTLNWLLKNWRLHKPRGSYNLLFTDSVQDCLEAMDEISAQCNFSQLLESCQKLEARTVGNGTDSSKTVDKDLVAVLEVSLANKTRENSTEQIVEAIEIGEDKKEALETYKIASVGTGAPDIIAIVGTTKESVPAAVEERSLSDMMSHFINALGFFSMSAIMGFVMYLL